MNIHNTNNNLNNKINTNKLAKGTYIILITLDDAKVLENKIIIE